MWTADADTYNAVFVDMLDYYLRLADETEGNPSPYQSRFNADGSYWLWQYERQKSPAEFDRLMRRVKDGHISAPLNTLVSCYGAQPDGSRSARFVLRGASGAALRTCALPCRNRHREPDVASRASSSLFAGVGGQVHVGEASADCATRLDPKNNWAERDREIYWYTRPRRAAPADEVVLRRAALPSAPTLEADEPGVLLSTYLETRSPSFLRRYTGYLSAASRTIHPGHRLGSAVTDLARKTGVTPPTLEIPSRAWLAAARTSLRPTTDHFPSSLREQQTTDERQSDCLQRTPTSFEDFRERTMALTLDASDTVTYGNEWDLYSASMSETSGPHPKRSLWRSFVLPNFSSTLVSLAVRRRFMKQRDMGARDRRVHGPRPVLGTRLDCRWACHARRSVPPGRTNSPPT